MSSSKNAISRRLAAASNVVKEIPSGARYGTATTSGQQRPPGMSMGAQAAFAQAQYGQPLNLQQQQALNQPPRKIGLQPPSRHPGPQQEQYYGGGGNKGMQAQQPGKILMSDAIALVTLRLGAAEQNIIDMQEQITDILINGSGGSGVEEYDEEGNLIPRMQMMGGGAAPPPSEDIDALKKEIDALKMRINGVEKTTKDVAATAGVNKNTQMVIQKLSSDNNMFKTQITQLTNLLNKNMAEMGRKFDEIAANITKLEYEQKMIQEQQQYYSNEDDDGGLHIELEDIHTDNMPSSDNINPMWNTAPPNPQNTFTLEPVTNDAIIENENNDIPPPQPVVVTNLPDTLKPLEPMAPTAQRRMGAAARLLQQQQSADGSKRPPPTPSIDL